VFTGVINQNFSDYLSYIPLVTPPIDENTYQVKSDFLNKRIIVIALLALTTFVGAVLFAPKFITVSLFCFILFPLDNWKNARAAHALAVKNYVVHPHPSSATFMHISQNLQAAKWLVNQCHDLNKTTATGESFLEFTLPSLPNNNHFIFFKFLVDHGFNWRAKSQLDVLKNLHHLVPETCFRQVVSCEQPQFLEYLLLCGQIQVSDFDDEEQVQLWLHIGHARAAHLLVEHGFDINIRNNQGYTPLLELIKKASIPLLARLHKLSSSRSDISAHVRMFLEYGANPLESVLDKTQGVMKNAFELNSDPEIALILNEYR
jgi:hypothetical protein